MTLFDITYKILKKLQEYGKPVVDGELLYNDLHEELSVYEFNFRYFLDSMQEQHYIKIETKSVTDWGKIEIMQAGIKYVNEYTLTEYTDINFNNFWDFLTKQLVKDTDDLIQAKKGAELHLATQLETLEIQKSLAGKGFKNILSFQHRQVETARHAVYKIDQVLERRRILAANSDNSIGNRNIPAKTVIIEKSNAPHFYKPDDFQKMVDELPSLDADLQVTDYLNYHYGNAIVPDLMSKMNWFTMLRKTLFLNGYRDSKDSINELPVPIRRAFWWGKQKSMELLKNNPIGLNKKKAPQKDQYNLGDYALMQVYLSMSGEGEAVTNSNKSMLADKYGFKGHKFYSEFNKYRETIQRTGTNTQRSDAIKKKRFEKVIKLLESHPKALKRAIDEQKTFITAFDRLY